jgi:hypothetical protein
MDINETNASVTLNQKECGDFFTNKEDQQKAIQGEEEKNKNTMGRVVSRLHFYLKGILQPS